MARPAGAASVEVEIRLALRRVTQQAVYSIYHNSPAQTLCQKQAALRLRRVSAAGQTPAP